jgi:hypothetical protein
MSDPELDRFKTKINLTEYAASRGYQLIRHETSRNSVAMKHQATGDKIIIARNDNNHWIFFTVGKTTENGSIVDFVQEKGQGGSLGYVRKTLRPWINDTVSHRPAPSAYAKKVETSTKDRQAILSQLVAMQLAGDHAYLASRGITKDILTHPRFAGRVYMDKFGGAVFPHEDTQGICGLEQRNRKFKGFPPGSDKGLWRSNAKLDDKRLVFCESAIDALSYHALHPDPHTRYMSFGGGWSDKTRTLIHRAAEKHPGPEIILAYDNDPAGHQYEADTRALLSDIEGKTLTAHYPATGKDWNEKLQAVAGRMAEKAVHMREPFPSSERTR